MNRAEPSFPDPGSLDRIPWDVAGDPLTLSIGPWSIGIRGLSPATARQLGHRWGGFCRPGSDEGSDVVLLCADRTAEGGLGLGSWQEGEVYRLEGALVEGLPLVRSYNFCMAPSEENPGNWKLVLGGAKQEPLERTIENAVRCIVSRLALAAGGFALHGAGIRRSGMTWIYAGPSGSGKSTAVRLSAPCESLGDDYALAFPRDGGWVTCAVPFDNSESAPDRPVPGLLPLGAILRLFQAGAGEPLQVEAPQPVLRMASLLNSVMFPNLFADLGEAVLENAGRFAAEGMFGHLYFHKDRQFVDRVLAFVTREN